MAMHKQEANFNDLMAINEQLIVEKRSLENQTEELTVQRRILENQTKELIVENGVLENQTEQLSRDRESLNRTLGTILKFNNFPVEDYCSGKSK